MIKRIINQFALILLFSNVLYPQIDCDWAFNPLDIFPSGGNTVGQSIKVDDFGNTYITGYFANTTDFDPGVGTANMTSYGGDDIFIAKYDTAGNYVYAKRIGGLSADQGKSIVLDNAGNVYITGSFSGTVDFDPGAGLVNLTSAGVEDIFIAKYDPAGNYIYAKGIGGTMDERGNSIIVDGLGCVYITGYFQGTADFNPGTGTANLTSAGNWEIFFAKYDASGNYVYAKRMGGTQPDEGKSIVLDSGGNVYITGYYTGIVDFDPGAGIANLPSMGSFNIFIAKYNTSGDYVYAKNIGGTGAEYGTSIDIDDDLNVYITGYFSGTVDFDPGAGSVNLTSAGGDDIFIAKYDASGNYIYAKSMGGASGNYSNSIAVDGFRNVYITGYFTNTADFDPGAVTVNLISTGSYDIFIAKYDTSGNYIYAKNMGGASADIGNSIAVNGAGDVYITGYFRETADFDPGAGTINLISGTGLLSAFIGKYDTSGNYIWAEKLGGYSSTSYVQRGQCVKVDTVGNVYATGYFNNTVDFDPGSGTANLTSIGGEDIFIAKYDAAGNYKYAISIGGASDDIANCIAVDTFGNVYIIGYYENTVDFDPGAGTANLTIGGVFIAKYDTAGNYMYAKKLMGTSGDMGNSIVTDSIGNIYITGYYSGTEDFDPDAGTAFLTSSGGTADIFIAKYDTAGNYIYANSMGAASGDGGNSIAVDGHGNIYITGNFGGTVDFDPGIGVVNLTCAGSNDIFIAKYDTAGDYVYAKRLGGTSNDYGYSVAIDSSRNVYLTGYFSGTADFNPDAGTANLISNGGYDIYIAKYDTSGNYIYAKGIGGIFSNDVGFSVAVDCLRNVYLAGNFSGTVDFDPGPGTANLSSSVGSADIFIVKYDTAGNYVYAKNIGGASDDGGKSIAVDEGVNVYLTGYFSGTADFDTGIGVINLNSLSSEDVFLAKYVMPSEIIVLGNGVFIADGDATPDTADYTDFGSVNMGTPVTMTFIIENTGPGVLSLTDAPKIDVSGYGFILTTDAPASINTGNTAAFQVTFTAPFCGQYSGTISIANNDINENPYTFSIAGTALDNVPPVTPSIADAIGECSVTPATPTTIDLCVGAITGTTLTTFPVTTLGITVVTWTFNDGNGNFTTANQNVFVNDTTAPTFTCPANIDVCENYSSINIAPANILDNCSQVIDVTYKMTGVTTGTGNNDASFESFNLGTTYINYIFDDGNGNKDSCLVSVTINPVFTYSENDTICAGDSYIWHGTNYNIAGTYHADYISTDGCDSTFTLNLSVNPLYTFTENQEICSGDTFNWQGTYYTDDGIYHANYLDMYGCDSIYELVLTLNTVDTSLTVTDPTIMANANADSYQWLDCDNVYAPISGMNLQSYTASANGNYAVIITQGLCSDTSACVPITTVCSTIENLMNIVVYPNPSNGMFSLELNETATVKIYNALGSLIYCVSTEEGKSILSLNIAEGVYLLNASNAKISRSVKLVIQK